MKQILVIAGLTLLALIVMDAGQVVVGPSGLTMKGSQAFAADLPTKAPAPAPVGKGKAPIIGKGKAPAVVSRY